MVAELRSKFLSLIENVKNEKEKEKNNTISPFYDGSVSKLVI